MAAAKENAGGRKPLSDKIWRDAIMRAVHREMKTGEKTKRLEALANKLVDKAINGDVSALKEIGDRLDGRPAQSMDGNLKVTGTINIISHVD